MSYELFILFVTETLKLPGYFPLRNFTFMLPANTKNKIHKIGKWHHIADKVIRPRKDKRPNNKLTMELGGSCLCTIKYSTPKIYFYSLVQ